MPRSDRNHGLRVIGMLESNVLRFDIAARLGVSLLMITRLA